MDLCTTTAADEALLLDLLNTTPVIDGVPTDALADFDTAARWMQDHDIPAREAEWTALVSARSTLQAISRGEQSPTTLQPFLTAARLEPVAQEDGVRWQLVVDGDTSGAVRAALAWDGLRLTSPGRLRPCANTECQLFLIDRSKPNTARWCSMALCGNRMKARRHYRRARSSEEH
ncbi:CGNR zinc finger domain-containing protein [Mycolicibacterium mengxianglii]|uniref:CGNR zinc finger domain-containing protein n=1 Tax=Mycolicibacterium mengxianglii TaxID=2736649 RepID=UPI0018EED3F2|nr:CGNR zinc finger domain-containing protein [Mycolicibacterium mengxianglii]